jgi:hypothetical protein
LRALQVAKGKVALLLSAVAQTDGELVSAGSELALLDRCLTARDPLLRAQLLEGLVVRGGRSSGGELQSAGVSA